MNRTCRVGTTLRLIRLQHLISNAYYVSSCCRAIMFVSYFFNLLYQQSVAMGTCVVRDTVAWAQLEMSTVCSANCQQLFPRCNIQYYSILIRLSSRFRSRQIFAPSKRCYIFCLHRYLLETITTLLGFELLATRFKFVCCIFYPLVLEHASHQSSCTTRV